MSGVAGPTDGRGRPAQPHLPPIGPAERVLNERIEQTPPRAIPCRTATRDTDPWLSERHRDRQTAVLACQGCPVAVECLATARELGARFGVWGGRDLTPEPVTAQLEAR